MKKNILKILTTFIAIISILILFIPSVNAITTDYRTLDDKTIISINNFSISELSFKDYSNTSALSFGLTGTVYNPYNEEVTLTSTTYYYDINKNLIATTKNSQNILSKKTAIYNNMSNLSVIPNNYNVSDIYYYQIKLGIYSNPNTSTITPSKNSNYKYHDYVIDSYDINIIVNENNTFDITENITAYFNISKHGIYRTIPLKNTITRLNGTTSTNKAQISNLSVDNEYTTSKENGNYKIKIGSASKTFMGEQKYTISYTYNIGKDPIDDYDELYLNLIGPEWDTVIGNVTFTITMPKGFEESLLGFSSGTTGSTNNSNIIYTIDGNVITGQYNGILDAGEALTVRCELPEGYFVNAGLTSNSNINIMFIIPILALTISLFLWYKYGRDDKIIETVEFYPPEGFNSLEVGFLYKGEANNQDITSLLIYLANKGYIEIVDRTIDLNSKKINLSEDSKNNATQKTIELQNKINEERRNNPSSEKIKYYENMLDIYQNIDTPIDYKQYGLKPIINKLSNKDDFVIRKIKDYDGTNLNEQWFMEGLFEYGRTEVTNTLLYNNFYETTNNILLNINNKKNKNQIFEKKASGKSKFIILLIILTLITIIAIPTLEYAGVGELGMTLFICLFYTPFFAVGIFVKMPIPIKIFWLGFTTFHSLAFFSSLPIANAVTTETIYLMGLLIGIACITGMIICIKLMPKRTQYGNQMLGQIKGFKNFLETVEKDKLESMVLQSPNYFYDILPYTYVLGVSDKWISKFETISMQAPSWYNSPTGFNTTTFGSFMKNTMVSANKAMSSSPSSSSSSGSSGGGSSGGGSSGGGSGGGGGGSW